jgi:hypothetical protein
MGIQIMRRACVVSAYCILSATNMVQVAGYKLGQFIGSLSTLESMISRTWSLWFLGCDEAMKRFTVLSVHNSRILAVSEAFLIIAGLVSVLVAGDRLLGTRFAAIALLIALPIVTVMPGPERASALVAALNVLWYLALIVSVITAIIHTDGWRDFLYALLTAGFVSLLAYPFGVAIAIVLLGVWTVLMVQRRKTVTMVIY